MPHCDCAHFTKLGKAGSVLCSNGAHAYVEIAKVSQTAYQYLKESD
jgi:hypothetical protein